MHTQWFCSLAVPATPCCTGLDEAGQNRYDALRKQYADAVRMHAYFEQKLERADAEHTKNRKLIASLKARLQAEGIDIDNED